MELYFSIFGTFFLLICQLYSRVTFLEMTRANLILRRYSVTMFQIDLESDTEILIKSLFADERFLFQSSFCNFRL